jgi:hypothetical protein
MIEGFKESRIQPLGFAELKKRHRNTGRTSQPSMAGPRPSTGMSRSREWKTIWMSPVPIYLMKFFFMGHYEGMKGLGRT